MRRGLVLGFETAVVLAVLIIQSSAADEEEGNENDLSPVIPLLAIGVGSVVIGFFATIFCVLCPCCPVYKRRKARCNSNEALYVYMDSESNMERKISPTSSIPEIRIIDVNENVQPLDVAKLDMALRRGSRAYIDVYKNTNSFNIES